MIRGNTRAIWFPKRNDCATKAYPLSGGSQPDGSFSQHVLGGSGTAWDEGPAKTVEGMCWLPCKTVGIAVKKPTTSHTLESQGVMPTCQSATSHQRSFLAAQYRDLTSLTACARNWSSRTRRLLRLQEDRRDLERRIKRMALQTLTDELTGLRNRHRFREDLEAAWAYAARQNLLLSLIVLDLDDLQSYNDAFGESAGDKLLCHLAAYLTSGQRAYDMIARFDGGEFALLLPSSDRTDGGASPSVCETAFRKWPGR